MKYDIGQWRRGEARWTGDGKPKPVSFPDPGTVSLEADGIRYIELPKLVELKLASGMTNAGRLKDLADVQELIKVLDLSPEFANQLHPFVRSKFHDLWEAATTPDLVDKLNDWDPDPADEAQEADGG
ncbi:MAG: hypothetical protein KY476_03100 [Planctomycetes bacterium]|nr:hypothetical protein [Planctomycetota bacterium]